MRAMKLKPTVPTEQRVTLAAVFSCFKHHQEFMVLCKTHMRRKFHVL